MDCISVDCSVERKHTFPQQKLAGGVLQYTSIHQSVDCISVDCSGVYTLLLRKLLPARCVLHCSKLQVLRLTRQKIALSFVFPGLKLSLNWALAQSKLRNSVSQVKQTEESISD